MRSFTSVVQCKRGLLVFVALAFISCISLLFLEKDSLYGQGMAERVPNLVGHWQAKSAFYMFDPVTNPESEPFYFESSGTEEDMLNIDVQTGRVFAGSTPDGGKLTGIILPDGTVSIQAFGEGELRVFGTYRLSKSGNTYKLEGYAHYFDDLKSPDAESMMATSYGVAVKVD
jgi:hypothetical protein